MNTSKLYLSIYLSTVIGGPDAERSPTGPDAIRHRSKSVGEPVQVELCPPVSARHLDDRHRRTVSGEQQGGRCRQRRPGRRQRRGGRRLVVGAGRRRTDARVWHPSLRRVFRPTASAIALRGLHLAADNVLRKQHTHPFNGPLSRTTWVSRYQKGKTNLDFTEARDSEWQWHQLGHVQVCTSLQTDKYASTIHHSIFTDRTPLLSPNQQRQSNESK